MGKAFISEAKANRGSTKSMAEAGPEEEEKAFGDPVCAECETGGVLETCDGCVRSWHVECLSHATPAAVAKARIETCDLTSCYQIDSSGCSMHASSLQWT